MQMTYTISFRRIYMESGASLLMELSNFLTTTIATVRSIIGAITMQRNDVRYLKILT